MGDKAINHQMLAVLLVANTFGFSTTASAGDFSFFQIFEEVIDGNFTFLESLVDSQLAKASQEYDKLVCRADYKEVEMMDFGTFKPGKMKEYYCDQQWYFKRLNEAGKALTKIFEGSESSPEKAVKVAAEIEDSLNLYHLPGAGDLAMELNYSLKYGVMRIKWKSKRDVSSCPGFMTQTVYKTEYDSKGNPYTTVTFQTVTFIDYVYREPSYTLSRVVNGVEEILVRTTEQREVKRDNFGLIFGIKNGLEADYWKLGNNIWKAIQVDKDKKKFEKDDVIWYDFQPDLRPKTSTLSYRLVAHASTLAECPKSRDYLSAQTADNDGDGEIDFVPPDDYRKFKNELYRDRNAALILLLRSLNK